MAQGRRYFKTCHNITVVQICKHFSLESSNQIVSKMYILGTIFVVPCICTTLHRIDSNIIFRLT